MEQLIGQIQAFGFNFTPRGWAFCNGQLLSISQNTALYSLLGITFGGDGITNFGLPDLRGRTIVHPGQGTGLTNPVLWGEKGGAQTVVLTQTNMPIHNHGLAGTAFVNTVINVGHNGASNTTENGENSLGAGSGFPNMYSEAPLSADKFSGISSTISGSTSLVGGSAPVSLLNPYLGIYTSIALYGIFPSRD
ncbi:phage tail protein [Flavobacterium sp. ZT3R18]|uniref:phage tail protein n=1 Tax=Flavobacterium sp. ZT3R18 TaxID=2594429 RepID=UPI00117A773E|nr:tail fiber protein [Flavobacterium sp. ZT3R18]TRX36407.1 phage tail protein [Flavobacterium sp. ZT3R18]